MGRDGEHCGVVVAAPLRKGWDREKTNHSIFCGRVLAAVTQCLDASALSLFRMKHISESGLCSFCCWFLLAC